MHTKCCPAIGALGQAPPRFRQREDGGRSLSILPERPIVQT